MKSGEKTPIEYSRNDLLCKDKFLTKNRLLRQILIVIEIQKECSLQ